MHSKNTLYTIRILLKLGEYIVFDSIIFKTTNNMISKINKITIGLLFKERNKSNSNNAYKERTPPHPGQYI